MKRSAPAQPRHICICLDISNSESLNQSQSYPLNEVNPEETSFKMQTPQKRKDFIRLGSKRKTDRLMQKEKTIFQTQTNLKTQFLTTIQPERKGSISKYFQSSKRILTNSTRDNLNINNTSNSCLLSAKNPNSSQKKRIQTETYTVEKQVPFKKLITTPNKPKILDRTLTHDRSKSRQNSCSLNKKFRNGNDRIFKKIQKIKEYKFVEEYLSDLEIQGILNELEIANVPEVKWPLIVVDKIYQLIRKKQFNQPHTLIIRKF